MDALMQAARNGHLDVIKWWIASGREIDLGTPGSYNTDAIGAAKKEGKTEVVNLLERFKGDAAKTRSEVRLELGINGESVHPAHLSPFPFFFFFLFFRIVGFDFLWGREGKGRKDHIFFFSFLFFFSSI